MTRRIAALAACTLALLIGAACGPTTEENGVLPTRVTLVTSTTSPGQDPTPTAEILTGSAQAAAPVPDDGLVFWQAAAGRLAPDTPDIWRFDALAGDEITVRVLGVDALLTLQAASGRIVTSGDSIRAELPEDGQYTVVVQTVEGRPGGDYQIGLGYADRPNPNASSATRVPEVVGVPTPTPAYDGLGAFIQQISAAGTLSGTLNDPQTPHVYTFEGRAGQFVRARMFPAGGSLAPRLTLYDPAGLPIAIDERSGGENAALLLNVRLPVDGLYALQAAGDSAGNYGLEFLWYDARADLPVTQPPSITATAIPTYGAPTPAPAVQGNRLVDHAPVQDSIDSPFDLAIYPLYAAAGEVITIGAGPVASSGVRLQLEVVDPAGTVIARASSDDSRANGDALITPLRADLEGVYQVFVTGLDGAAGAYQIAFGRGSSWLNTAAGTPQRDVANQGVISRRGVRDIWSLDLRAGDIITVAANPVDPLFDPILEVVAADEPDTLLAIDDNSGGDRAAFIRRVEIPRDGLYLLRVKAAQAASTGPYTLIWRYINVGPTATPQPGVAPLLVLDDTIAENAYAFYPFQGTAGQRVRISVAAVDGAFDPVLALIGPDGAVIAEADDRPGSLDPLYVGTLPVDGTYNVRVNGYLSSGPFTLRVETLFEEAGR
ncbi:MAG: PPC domain-containing protein [Chloroflexota bacterium]